GEYAPVGSPQLRRQAETDLRFQGDQQGFSCLAFTADGKSLLWSRWNDRQLTVTNVSGEGKDGSWPIRAHRIRVSPDGKYLTSDWGYDVRLHDAKTGKELHKFAGYQATDRVAPHCFSPDSRLLAVVRGLTVDVW